MKPHKFQYIPVVVGIAIALGGTFVAMSVGRLESRRYRLDAVAVLQDQLGTVRAAVERSLNERIYLTLGLRAYVSTNPNITENQFAQFAAALMQEGKGIRSCTLIKDNIISDVYPREGNEAALGIKLLEIPAQRDDVMRSIESRRPWLSAPIKLVQGGEAFVNRAPVYETPQGGKPGSGRYWGLVSILINKDELLNDIVRGLPSSLRFALRVKSKNGADSDYFFGDKSIESSRPLKLDVNLPTGDWQVLGVPVDGWPKRAPASWKIEILGILASLCSGLLTCMLLRSNDELRIARSISERAVVQLSRKNEDLEAFVRTASHDLRSPLRHIGIYSGYLIEDAGQRLNDEDRKHVKVIQNSIDRMTHLLNSLLRFAETGADGIKPARFSLSDATKQVLELLTEEKQQRVKIGDLPEVTGDRTLLTQVLQNLIENALKYHEGDGSDAHVEVTSTSTEHETTVSVADNGIGMDARQLRRIFKAGVRGVSPDAYTGSGFGLAICERIIKAHDGKLWAESTPGEGSIFRFTLPKK